MFFLFWLFHGLNAANMEEFDKVFSI